MKAFRTIWMESRSMSILFENEGFLEDYLKVSALLMFIGE
jgi:hypothetical protein